MKPFRLNLDEKGFGGGFPMTPNEIDLKSIQVTQNY